jgi:phosphatidylserine/phosphatidylglycerophosphate/cardiolipin synthase-like enzyme
MVDVKPPPRRRPARFRLLLLTLASVLTACGTPSAVANRPARPPLPYPDAAGPPLRVGSDTISILPRGSTAFPVILSLIAGARSSVHAEMYEFGRDDIARALVDAHGRGVAVTVIVDPSVAATRVTAQRLRAAGLDVLDYPVRKQMIDHAKLLVVDGSVAVVGGINWGATSDRNHDVDARISGPAATNLERIFDADMVACGRATAVPAPADDAQVLVAATLPGVDVRPLVMQLIDSARTSLALELFVLTDTGVVHAIESAAGRGVAVRVLLDPSQRPSDAAESSLLSAGVTVRRYRSSGEKLHAKVGVADGRTSVFGSANWTSGGFQRNHEIDVEVLDSPAIAAQLTRMVDADWTASAP